MLAALYAKKPLFPTPQASPTEPLASSCSDYSAQITQPISTTLFVVNVLTVNYICQIIQHCTVTVSVSQRTNRVTLCFYSLKRIRLNFVKLVSEKVEPQYQSTQSYAMGCTNGDNRTCWFHTKTGRSVFLPNYLQVSWIQAKFAFNKLLFAPIYMYLSPLVQSQISLQSLLVVFQATCKCASALLKSRGWL